jgi:hypothetical protein
MCIANMVVKISGKYTRELESTRLSLLSSWVGDDVAQYMGRAGDFFNKLGGYILPGPRPRNN